MLRFHRYLFCLQRWGGVHPPGRHSLGRQPPPPGRQTASGQTHTPTGRHRLWADTPPSDAHCSGRYACYWNAFLFCMILTLFSHLPLKVVYKFSIETWPYPCVLRGQAGHTNGSLTLQLTASDTDSDSDPIPVVGS